MSKIEATNDFVFIILDEAEKEKLGLVIPGSGQEKPSQGTIVTVGELVGDIKIKAAVGRKCLFHKGSGFGIPFDGVDYQVMESMKIIALV